MVLDIANLNTSHVKVKLLLQILFIWIILNLNTSHVKVKLSISIFPIIT